MKNVWLFLIPRFTFFGQIISSTSSPALKRSILSFKINSKSTERGAESKQDTWIDFGFSSGLAMISNGRCFINGQQPDSNKSLTT